MNLQQEIRGDVLILKPVGRLDSASSPDGGSAVVAGVKVKWTRKAHEKRVKEMVAAGLDPKKEAAKAKADRAAAKKAQ